jgi:hypothetical protein
MIAGIREQVESVGAAPAATLIGGGRTSVEGAALSNSRRRSPAGGSPGRAGCSRGRMGWTSSSTSLSTSTWPRTHEL